MEPRFSRLALALLSCLGAASLAAVPAAALEIGVEGRAGNLHFPWAEQAPVVGDFPATNLFWGGAAWIQAPLGPEASLRAGYETDPVLRHVAGAQVQFERGIARVAVGPFVGAFNSESEPFSAGLSTAIRFQWPGIAFVSVRSDGGLSVGILASTASAGPQSLAELSAGFYVPNAIVSGAVTAKRFIETDPAGFLVVDALSRYMLSVDVFKKNVPYNLVASAGYQLRSKYYEASDKTDALGSLVLGLKATAQAAPGIKITGDLSSGFFVFGLEELSGRGPSMESFMFSASLGVVVDTALLAPRAPRAAKEAEEAAAPAAPAASAETTAGPPAPAEPAVTP